MPVRQAATALRVSLDIKNMQDNDSSWPTPECCHYMALTGTLGLHLVSEKWQWSQLSYASVGCINQSPPEGADLIGKWQACEFRVSEEQLQPWIQNNCRRKLTARVEGYDTVSLQTKGREKRGTGNGMVSCVDHFCVLVSVRLRRISQTWGQVWNITLLFTIIRELSCTNHLTSARLGLQGVKELTCVKALADDSPSQQGYFLNYPSVPGTQLRQRGRR